MPLETGRAHRSDNHSPRPGRWSLCLRVYRVAMREFTRTSIGAVTSIVMAISTFPQVVFGVLAVELIREFDADRWQIGALVTATGVTGALLAPWLGHLTDRVGALRATRSVLAVAFGGLVFIGLAPSYLLLVAAALISGAPQGWCNSATNSLIVDALPQGERGVVTGVKQSGVQAGIFLGGMLLPFLAERFGWRAAVLSFTVTPVVGLLATVGRKDGQRHHSGGRAPREPIGPLIRWVTIYGFLSGLGTSAMLTFLPLFASEDQGWSDLQAGWLLAGVGLIGIAARISWGPVSESKLGHGRVLVILSLLTVISSLILSAAAAELVPTWTLGVAGLLLGAGGVAWNTVGMLAVMHHSPGGQVGRGTGFVLFGFLLGYGGGAPLLGLSVDLLDSYAVGWLAVAGLFLIANRVGRRIAIAETTSGPAEHR